MAAGSPDEQNKFRTLWDLGYTRLVPVVPPGVDLASKGAMARRLAAGQDPRGKAPGVLRGDGTWSGFNFVAMESRESDLDTWHSWGASAGIKLGDGLIAVDVDTRDRKAAFDIYELAGQYLGPGKVRFGESPKCLMMYEAPKDTPYRSVTFSTPTGDREKVEILSEGRQFVALGVHPKTGNPYKWREGIPARNQVTNITAEQLQNFLEAVVAAMPGAVLTANATPADAPDQAALKAPSWEALTTAVEAMPNNDAMFPTRDDYVRVAYAIKAAAPDGYEHTARDLYLDWCDRWETDRTDEHAVNDPTAAVGDWDRAKGPFRVGYEFIVEHAPALFFEPQAPSETDDMFAANADATGETQRQSGVFELLRIGDIFSLPDPVFAIDRHIPEAAMGFLYGRPGCGKSFVALDWALHMAYGLPTWHGDAIAIRPGANVLYLAREGSTGFKARIRAWQQHHLLPEGVEPAFALIRQTINFMQADDIQKLMRTVRSSITGPVDLIVVDTVSRVLPGADENLQKEMTLFVRACDALQDAFHAIVLGVHHSGKSGDMRGSSVLKGAGDFVFKLDRKEGAKAGKLICEKQKDAPDGWAETYAFSKIEFEGGSSLVPVRMATAEAESDTCEPARREIILAAIDAAWNAGTPWSPAPQSRSRYAGNILSRDFDVKAEVGLQWLGLWESEGLIVQDEVSARTHTRGYRRVTETDEGVFE